MRVKNKLVLFFFYKIFSKKKTQLIKFNRSLKRFKPFFSDNNIHYNIINLFTSNFLTNLKFYYLNQLKIAFSNSKTKLILLNSLKHNKSVSSSSKNLILYNNNFVSSSFSLRSHNLIFFLLELNFFIKNLKSLIFFFLLLEFRLFQNKIKNINSVIENKQSIENQKRFFSLFKNILKLRHSLLFLSKRREQRLILEQKKKSELLKQLNKKIEQERLEKIRLQEKFHKELYYKYNKRTRKLVYNSRPHPKHVEKITKKYAILEAKLEKNSVVKKTKKFSPIVFSFFRKLIGVSTKRGLRKKAIKIFRNSFINVKKDLNLNISPNKILDIIYKKLNPLFVLRKFNLGRRVILIPLPLRKEKRISVTARLFINAVKQRAGTSFEIKLTEEFKDFLLKKRRPASMRAKSHRLKLAIENKSNLRFLKYKKKKRRR